MTQQSRLSEYPAPGFPIRFWGAGAYLLPWLVSSILRDSEVLSWWIAWFGSWFIVLLVFTGSVFPLPRDRKFLDQVLRPWFLMHLVFASYNCLTSVFYWIDVNGFSFGLGDLGITSEVERPLAASAQRYYVLAHAGLAIGLGMIRQTPRDSRAHLSNVSVSALMINVALGSVALSFVVGQIPGLEQLGVKLHGLFIVASATSLGLSYQEKSDLRYVALVVNAAIFLIAMMSGWKGGPIVMVILVAAAFYPRAPRRTALLASMVLAVGMLVLPSTSKVIRDTAWRGEATQLETVREVVVELESKSSSEVLEDSWRFAVERMSEASLFVRYLDKVPEFIPYFGTQIIEQASLALIPRIMWPEKPDIERVVHERVTALSIVEESSDVSAKPQFLVDGYLTAGAIGIFGAMILYGVIAQMASNCCAKWLGGYLTGGVAFNGLFSILWTGSAFEFVANSVLWSFVMIFALHWMGIVAGALRK